MLFLFSRERKVFSFLVLNLLFLFSSSIMALTISSNNTTDVDSIYDSATNTITYIAKTTRANILNREIITALSNGNVKIQGNDGADIIFDSNVHLDWGSPYNLIINAPRNLMFNNGSQILARGAGNLILRTDTDGNNNGTLIPPPNQAATVFINGGGMVKVYYRTLNFQQPTEFDNLIKVASQQLTTYMLINNADELQDMNQNLSGNYALAKSIIWPNKLFSPIGIMPEFTGEFDGQGYAISNLQINLPNSSNIGLFGYTNRSTIQNLQLKNASIRGGWSVGGIIGTGYYSNLINVSFSGSVRGERQIGGLVGISGGKVIQCFSEGVIEGKEAVGGLVGRGASIENSYSKANVHASEWNAGGLVGEVWEATYNHNYAAGRVSAAAQAGGLVGLRWDDRSVFINSYWDVPRTGQTKPAFDQQLPGAFGLPTALLYQKASYRDWDFTTTWAINEGIDYPYLVWTTISPPFTTIPNGNPGSYKIIG